MSVDLRIRKNMVSGDRHFSLDVAFSSKAKRIALFGPSGAGKSLTLRAVAGLLRPDAGRIDINGRALFDSAQGICLPPQSRRVAYLFQDYALFPHLTVAQNVAFGMRRGWRNPPRKQVSEQARRWVDAFELGAIVGSYPHEISGGQKQRVALARALVKNAPLILLDEPLVNLDYKLREELRDELSALFAQGRSTVIYATTEPGEALLLGGYTAVLDEGRLLQYGPTAEVFHRPSSIRVARAFSDPPMNLFAAARRPGGFELPGGVRVERPLPAGAGDITAGLRAGALDVHEQPGHIALDSVVKLAEISGSDTFVHAETAAGEVVAQLPGVHRCTLDQRLRLYFDPAQTYAFGADGALLAAPGWLAAPVAKEAR